MKAGDKIKEYDATVIKELDGGFTLVFTGEFVELADVRVIKTPKAPKKPPAKKKS